MVVRSTIVQRYFLVCSLGFVVWGSTKRQTPKRQTGLSHIMKHPVHIFILFQSFNEFTYVFRFCI